MRKCFSNTLSRNLFDTPLSQRGSQNDTDNMTWNMENGKWEIEPGKWYLSAIANVKIIRLEEGPRIIGGSAGGDLQNMQLEETNIKRFGIPEITDFHKNRWEFQSRRKTRLNQKWDQEWRDQTKNRTRN